MKEKIRRPYEDRTNHKLAYTLLQLLVMIKILEITGIKYICFLFLLLLLLISFLIFFPSTHHFCSFFTHASSPVTHSTYRISRPIRRTFFPPKM